MALRDLPYIKLDVNSFTGDERLNECSAAANGVYIRLMCLLHKQNPYGVYLLKQTVNQSVNQTLKTLASQLAKHMPFKDDVIESALTELCDNNVIKVYDNRIEQKRMIHDNEVSQTRATVGKNGGLSTQEKNRQTALSFAEANTEAKVQPKPQPLVPRARVISAVNKNDESNTEGKSRTHARTERKAFVPPTIEEVENYFVEKGYRKDVGTKAFNYYNEPNQQGKTWVDFKGNQVLNWKQKMISVWFKQENIISKNETGNTGIDSPGTTGKLGRVSVDKAKSFMQQRTYTEAKPGGADNS